MTEIVTHDLCAGYFERNESIVSWSQPISEKQHKLGDEKYMLLSNGTSCLVRITSISMRPDGSSLEIEYEGIMINR